MRIHMANTLQEKEAILPRRLVKINGKVRYSEGNQAWNLIKLKTEFLNEFKQLKEKRSNFSYEMVFGRSKAEMIETLKRTLEDESLMPVLMFLYKEKGEYNSHTKTI
jgi:hypothetical protein